MRIAVLMPAYNEAGRLLDTLTELCRDRGDAEICVFLVDDGSTPPLARDELRAAAGAMPIVLARHAVNLGQGAAIETARQLALRPRFSLHNAPFDAFVTMDSDGQHRPCDVLALARAIADGADVALGNRFAGGSNVPLSRRLLLAFARSFERVTTGLALSDAHNGLRAFSARAITRMHLTHNRMAHATEFTQQISRASRNGERLGVIEVPVSVRYTDASRAKGQKASGAVAIVVDLFHGFLFGKGSP
ncbi:MAG: glycosyltransferase family 2 protein [Polyangiaceae bacterium]|nr:glycosyltransferase family 2 protein [Polyangiaceae bacterium]